MAEMNIAYESYPNHNSLFTKKSNTVQSYLDIFYNVQKKKFYLNFMYNNN